MRLHCFVDAVKQVVWSEPGQDSVAIERLLGSDRFQPRNGKADISSPAMTDDLSERFRRGKVDVCDAARFEDDKERRAIMGLNCVDHAAFKSFSVGEEQRRIKGNDDHALLP